MTVFLSALAIGLASVLLGAAICCRRAWTWTAPAVGLAALMLITLVAVRLPGHGATAAGAVAVALVLSAVALVRARVDLRPLLAGLPVAAAVLAFCALPFLANGRVGELGAGALDDLSFHMVQADVLRESGTARHVLAHGYPIGPHAVVATLAEGTGIDVESAFTGLMFAAPMLLALVALAAFDGVPWPLRMLGAALVGVPYLISSYVSEGAFKEPLLALFFTGFLLTLREVVRDGRLEPRHLAALLLTAAGGVADFGAAALAWPGGTLVVLGLLEYGLRMRSGLRLPRVRVAVTAGAAGLAALAVIVLAARSSGFFDTGPGRYLTDHGAGGNFVGQLSPFEALGVWPSPDLRLTARAKWWFEPGVAIAVAVVLYGAFWCVRRRERVLLAGALTGVGIYVVARPVTLAYFSGKALAVAAPILALIGIRALVDAAAAQDRQSRPRRAAGVAVLALFALLTAYSSALALRGAHVRPTGRGPDLAAFRPLVRDADVLYLGRDNYVGWDLRGSRVSGFQSYRSAQLRRLMESPQKSAGTPPPAVDFDSPSSGTLDRYRFVVGPRTAYASVPPPSFRPVARTRWHVLWERHGRAPGRRILAEGEAPGAVLDCRNAAGRRLSRERGVAFVRPRPVVGPAGSWRDPAGSAPATPGVTTSGRALVQTLVLGRGVWEISLRYFSDGPLRVRLGRTSRSLPAYVGDRSSFVAAGRVRSAGGELRIEARPAARRRLDIVRTTLLGSVAAVRVDERGRERPLKRACGQYVDWYRLDG